MKNDSKLNLSEGLANLCVTNSSLYSLHYSIVSVDFANRSWKYCLWYIGGQVLIPVFIVLSKLFHRRIDWGNGAW